QVDEPCILKDNFLCWIIPAYDHDPPISEIAARRTVESLWRCHLLACPAVGCNAIAIDACYSVYLLRIRYPTQQYNVPFAIRGEHGIPYSHRQWRKGCPLITGDIVSIPACACKGMRTERVHESLSQIEMAFLVGNHRACVS